MSHTPTPWRTNAKHPSATNGTQIFAESGSLRREYVTIATLDKKGARANAELIVRAVNSHRALIDALEKIASTYKPVGATHEEMARDMREQARAALLSAKGEA